MIFLCIVITEVGWKFPEISNLITASGDTVLDQRQYWRIFTTTFAHSDLAHLLSNCYMLGIIGYFVFGYFGMMMYPLTAVVAAAIINLISICSYPKEVTLLGASGMIYYLYGFWLTMFVCLERRFTFASRLIRVIGFGLIVLFPTTFEKQVSYRTHLIGFLLGIPVAIAYFYWNKKVFRKVEEWIEVEED